MSPHMHTRGLRFKYEAVYPAGHNPTNEVLLSVPNYEFHWQTAYRFTQPKYLPRGTRIKCTAAWDNSVQNSDLMEAYIETGNPDYSPAGPYGTGTNSHVNVQWGDQTWEEMFIGFFNYSVATNSVAP